MFDINTLPSELVVHIYSYMNTQDMGIGLYVCKWLNECINTHYNSIIDKQHEMYMHPQISIDNRIKSIEDEHEMLDYNRFDMNKLSDIEKFKVMIGNSKYSFDNTRKRYKCELIQIHKSDALWMNLNTFHKTKDGNVIYSVKAYELWWKVYLINNPSHNPSHYISYTVGTYEDTVTDEMLIDIYREELELKLYAEIQTYKN